MTIGSPRRFFSSSRGRVIGRREASAGGWMFGCALMGESASRLSVGIEDGVVDETGGADAGGDGDEDLAVDRARPATGRRCGRTRGTRARRRARASRPARRRAARRRRARRRPATPRRPRRASRSASARSRSAPCRWTLRLDSARPSGSRTVGQHLDAHGQVEVAHQAADDERLLRVLLAEEGHVGADHVQQLGDHGRDAVEVGDAAVLALERLGDGRRCAPSWRSPGG